MGYFYSLDFNRKYLFVKINIEKATLLLKREADYLPLSLWSENSTCLINDTFYFTVKGETVPSGDKYSGKITTSSPKIYKFPFKVKNVLMLATQLSQPVRTGQSPITTYVTSFQPTTMVNKGEFSFVDEKSQNVFWSANIYGWNSQFRKEIVFGSVSGLIKYEENIITIALNGAGVKKINNVSDVSYTSQVEWDYNLIVFF